MRALLFSGQNSATVQTFEPGQLEIIDQSECFLKTRCWSFLNVPITLKDLDSTSQQNLKPPEIKELLQNCLLFWLVLILKFWVVWNGQIKLLLQEVIESICSYESNPVEKMVAVTNSPSNKQQNLSVWCWLFTSFILFHTPQIKIWEYFRFDNEYASFRFLWSKQYAQSFCITFEKIHFNMESKIVQYVCFLRLLLF